ncbi:hypothetical protein CTI12_AA513120 [Artemisia annua]|uniref:Uncharacterized protein n=1 Tax=Artemisia annua TaxID=35608 RepID=A0A2U1LAG2_ARTAN|nr:hypothetical protein CTI12_AA513120 [Artemisia annua]
MVEERICVEGCCRMIIIRNFVVAGKSEKGMGTTDDSPDPTNIVRDYRKNKTVSVVDEKVSGNVVRNRRRQNYRMPYDAILKDPAADVMLGAAGSVQRSITEGTRSDDEVNMVARLLIDIANGSSETRTSSGIVPEARALAETVGRSSVMYIPTNVANGSGHHYREQVGLSSGPKEMAGNQYG